MTAFKWCDFWRTGLTAKIAAARRHGVRRDGFQTHTEKREHWIAERGGPRGGVTIRYYSAARCPVCSK